HRQSLKHYFTDGWNPSRALSHETMDGLRRPPGKVKQRKCESSGDWGCRRPASTHTPSPPSSSFRISPEAIRRFLKSRWEP
ncbi:hypothetical protein B0H11DRAFT_1610836, partial [Mycena galericulata]